MNDLWNALAGLANLTLSDDQHAKLSRYLDLLLEANQMMNLTRITDRAAAEVQHVGDALTVLPFLPAAEHLLADVGTGGGVPGIPLAIARSDAQVVLIEATKKKAAFLRKCVEALELANVTVRDERVEDVGHDPRLRERCDIAIARAVATMAWLAEWCLPLVKPRSGRMLALKGPKALEELPQAARAIRTCNGGEPIVHPVNLPGTENHLIIEITKVGPTQKHYPRPATQAKGKSL